MAFSSNSFMVLSSRNCCFRVGLHKEIQRRGLGATMVMQVHDELLLEVQKKALQETAEIARKEMEGVAEMLVPLKVELKWGSNWAEMRAGS